MIWPRLLVYKTCFSCLQALALNKDGNFFVSGGFSRYLRVWRTHDLCLLHTYPPCDGSIRALAISTDQRYGVYMVSSLKGLCRGHSTAFRFIFALKSLRGTFQYSCPKCSCRITKKIFSWESESIIFGNVL